MNLKTIFDRYALVLAGGGAKGAYQIGAWKALCELGIKFNAIMGASVGALNGALIVQGDLKLATDLWENITLEKVIRLSADINRTGYEQFPFQNKFSMLRNVWKNIVNNKGLDTAPIKDLINKNIDEEIIRNSGIEFGLVMFGISEFKPYEIFINEIQQGLLKDYIIASISFPGFQSMDIKGKKFMDGGIHDNIPYGIIKEKGYKKIIVIDVSGLGRNRRPDIAGTDTIYIKNSIEMGGILDFSQGFIKPFMELGYLDTMKVFGRVEGIEYFYKINRKTFNKLENLLFKDKVFLEYIEYFTNKISTSSRAIYERKIRDILPEKVKNFRFVLQALAEEAAKNYNINKIKLYDFDELVNLIWNEHKSKGRISDRPNNTVNHLPTKIFITLLKHYFNSGK